ncbi:MAG TPA: Crp/Fnr family transcriptional regulator [Bacillales bacterium]|nr:Crp/Fnr family transcriptional regulator [Bacillales bacterium]
MECNHSCDGNNAQKLCVSGVPIFNHLSNQEMLEIVETSRTKVYRKGEFIFKPGDLSGNLLIIHKGRVKMYRVSESGKEQLLRLLEPGDFIGDLSLFTNETSDNYAETMVETEICAIHRTDMQQFLINHPLISIKILEEISKRLNEAEKTIERLSLQDAEKRLASYLVELIKNSGKDEAMSLPINILLPMSKKDLASYIGTTKETLSRRLSSFQENGWISLTGQRNITIHNFDALLELI